ncbi:hypothetical protein K443DRAFT_638411 [Laccaria amethystina LaAM-08-1]|uniref:Uncharacterized protein n=1 Tax=Laccaria amethystina LaAM-08-1 TaxID=1095629 RepID=A0A0C9XCW7_9AGAR|nr:hypothetical protein K443DRAFT_638411 [Laccaria amethystina LaAM-08-1]
MSQVLPSVTFALPQHFSTTPHRQSLLVFAGPSYSSFIDLAGPAPDAADEAMSLLFRGEVASPVGPPPHGNLMQMYTQHESAVWTIQTMVNKLDIYHSTPSNVASDIETAHSCPLPLLSFNQ